MGHQGYGSAWLALLFSRYGSISRSIAIPRVVSKNWLQRVSLLHERQQYRRRLWVGHQCHGSTWLPFLSSPFRASASPCASASASPYTRPETENWPQRVSLLHERQQHRRRVRVGHECHGPAWISLLFSPEYASAVAVPIAKSGSGTNARRSTRTIRRGPWQRRFKHWQLRWHPPSKQAKSVHGDAASRCY